MRDLRVLVPGNYIAFEDAAQGRQVLMLIQRVLKAETTPSTELRLDSMTT